MEKRMTEEELVLGFEEALQNGYIFAVYQPQINHATGRMVGAEALMRWKHPEYGMQFPSDFIPVLEKQMLIMKADLYIFEQVCKFQRKCMDEEVSSVPISFNVSRYDIYYSAFADEMEEIRKKYDVPVYLLRVEITESSAVGGMELVSGVLSKLHELGYVVEMDDFGSGYSSLNVLKDLDVDILKLDMNFLSGKIGGRGGAILSSIVQMAKWISTPVIAEGVETMEQADYMKSIGCNYIQGYLYSKPVEAEEFAEKLRRTNHDPISPGMKLISTMDAGKFWNPESLETLIFSNFVGGAAIFTYEDGKIEMLRVNEKYIKELGMNLSAKDLIRTNPWTLMDESNRAIYEKTILRAVESEDEEECETWRTIYSDCCGEDTICIRSSMRMIGKAGKQYLFYVMVRNVTTEKKRVLKFSHDETILKAAFEQANVYAWEYIVATKDMHPCFRCMRDLSLPPVVHNYPEPVIESGLFPADYADMYRDWMQQIDEGLVDSLEAVIPLTVGRVPFHVRYTMERDESGRPLKAYGSATLVVDGGEE